VVLAAVVDVVKVVGAESVVDVDTEFTVVVLDTVTVVVDAAEMSPSWSSDGVNAPAIRKPTTPPATAIHATLRSLIAIRLAGRTTEIAPTTSVASDARPRTATKDSISKPLTRWRSPSRPGLVHAVDPVTDVGSPQRLSLQAPSFRFTVRPAATHMRCRRCRRRVQRYLRSRGSTSRTTLGRRPSCRSPSSSLSHQGCRGWCSTWSTTCCW